MDILEMIRSSITLLRRITLAAAALMVVLVVVSGTTAFAQVNRSREASASNTLPAQRGVLVDVEEEVDHSGADRGGPRTKLTPETIDQWVLNGPLGTARQNHLSMINSEIEQIDAVCALTAEQKRMLQLAGAGELQRIGEAMAMLHTQYAGRTFAQDKLGEVFQEIQQVQQQVLRRPLASTSLLYKLAPSLLDSEQEKKFSDWIDARQRMRLRGQIDVAVAAIDKRVPLRHSQRQALIRLLESDVVLILPDADGVALGTPQSTVLAQMNAIDRENFVAFLNSVQWEAMQEVFLPHRSALRTLQQRGLIQKVKRQAPVPEPPAVDEPNQQREVAAAGAEAVDATLTRQDTTKERVDGAANQDEEKSR